MNFPQLTFTEANKNLPLIGLVGIALGVANYALGIWETLGQSLIQQIIMSFVIGYSLLLIGYNFPFGKIGGKSKIKEHSILIALFALVGIIGTESDSLVKKIFFGQGEFQLFNFGGIHVFNIVLTVILGFVTRNFTNTKPKKWEIDNEPENSDEPLTVIPIKRGEAIVLHAPEEVIFFEAYDNYSFLHDLSGNKYLCNYSLLFLEKKLGKNFLRIHRKYLINRAQIFQIKPHFKKRFIIEFKDSNKTSVTSGAGYAEEVKGLFKL